VAILFQALKTLLFESVLCANCHDLIIAHVCVITIRVHFFYKSEQLQGILFVVYVLIICNVHDLVFSILYW